MGWLSIDWSLDKNQNDWSNEGWKACLSLLLIPNSQNALCSLMLKNCRWNCVSEWVWIVGLFFFFLDYSKVYSFPDYQNIGTEYLLLWCMSKKNNALHCLIFQFSEMVQQYRLACCGLQVWCWLFFHYLLIPTDAPS